MSHHAPLSPAASSRWLRSPWPLLLVWLLALIFGGAAIGHYATTDGARGEAPARWPAESAIAPRAGRSTALIFAHPQCPCTAASLAEFGGVIAESASEVDAYALFLDPQSLGDDWTHSRLWEQTERLDGVDCIADIDGHEAALFGAHTSGQVLLYDQHGELIFQGGVTGSRGHEGPNQARSTLAEKLAGTSASTTPSTQGTVFGCPLFSPQDEPGCATASE